MVGHNGPIGQSATSLVEVVGNSEPVVVTVLHLLMADRFVLGPIWKTAHAMNRAVQVEFLFYV